MNQPRRLEPSDLQPGAKICNCHWPSWHYTLLQRAQDSFTGIAGWTVCWPGGNAWYSDTTLLKNWYLVKEAPAPEAEVTMEMDPEDTKPLHLVRQRNGPSLCYECSEVPDKCLCRLVDSNPEEL